MRLAITLTELSSIGREKDFFLFYSVKEFDCKKLYFGNRYLNIPISDIDYRKQYPTKARVIITEEESYVRFHIFDDWGDQFIVTLPYHYEEEIKKAKAGAEIVNGAPSLQEIEDVKKMPQLMPCPLIFGRMESPSGTDQDPY